MEIDPTVTLAIPATPQFALLARTAASAMCARLGFTVDRIEDVKLAVDEAVGLLLGDAVEGSTIQIAYRPEPPRLHVVLSAPTVHGRSFDRASFSWTVLTSLVDDLSIRVGDDRRLTIELTAQQAEARLP